jgi:serine protease Do
MNGCRPFSGSGRCWLPLVMGLLMLPPTAVDVGAQGQNGVFDEAIRLGQQRVVKVYGATAGRVDGYSSGILVSEDGLIVTMQGVYLDGYNVRVVMPDGTRYPANVLRRHRALQLALLKIEAVTPNYFELSETPVGSKGDWVVTLSNAFKVAEGVEPMSVNLGIISLRTEIDARLSPRDVAYSGKLVLIDAITSNPGAGGGAVISVDGQLVGSIGRVINSSETNTRLNYAVPAALLKQFVAGTLPEAEVAVAARSAVPADLGLRLFKLGGRGQPAYIDRVIRNSPAWQARLRPDDLVISLNGEKVGTVREFESVMETIAPGQEVIIIVKRGRDLLRIPITAVEKK